MYYRVLPNGTGNKISTNVGFRCKQNVVPKVHTTNVVSTAFLSLSPAGTWKRNKDRDLSTAGTTASIVVFRKDHFYVANVGDSSVVMGKCGGGDQKR